MKKIGAVIFFAAVIFAFAVYHRRNGIILNSSKNNVICFKQSDDKWKADMLGNSKYNMENSGCLVSCIASALNMQNIVKETNPKDLNRLFSERNVYDDYGNIQWDILENVLGVRIVITDKITAESINQLLKDDIFPIVKVKIGGTADHYVLIVGAQNGDFVCMNPADGKETSLRDFGNKIYTARYISRKTHRSKK